METHEIVRVKMRYASALDCYEKMSDIRAFLESEYDHYDEEEMEDNLIALEQLINKSLNSYSLTK